MAKKKTQKQRTVNCTVSLRNSAGVTNKFKSRGRKRLEVGCGEVIVNGEVIFADGSHHSALLRIDESSGGELMDLGAFIDYDDGSFTFEWQQEGKLLKALGKSEADVFPYIYKYVKGLVQCVDYHVDSVCGWSY